VGTGNIVDVLYKKVDLFKAAFTFLGDDFVNFFCFN